MLRKPWQGDAGEVLVIFSHDADDGVQRMAVVGEFNDWSADAHPMSASGTTFSCAVALSPGRQYRFRYLVDGHSWRNDWAADAYLPNDFGGDDSVVDLTEAAVPAAPTVPGAPGSKDQAAATLATEA